MQKLQSKIHRQGLLAKIKMVLHKCFECDKEIKEEYCADVLDFEFLGYRDVHREHNGVKTHWIALDFKVRIDPTKIKNGEPHKFEEVKLFTLNTIPDNVHSQFPNFLSLYRKRIEAH